MALRVSGILELQTRDFHRQLGEAKLAVDKFHRDVEASSDRSNKSLQRMEDSFQRIRQNALSGIGQGLTLGLTVPILGASAAVVKLASDYQDVQNKVRAAFGASAGEIKRWAETTSTSFAQTSTQAQNAAADFALIFKAMGAPEKDIKKMSTGLTRLASDLTSLHSATIPRVEDALVKLRAGIVGETEPLRRIGIVLEDETLKREAARLGLVAYGKELTQQEKVMARYSIIMQQSKPAHDDFIRTRNDLSNVVRESSAILIEEATKLGVTWIPTLTEMVKLMRGASEQFVKWPGWAKTATAALIGLAAVAGPIIQLAAAIAGIRAFGALKGGIDALKAGGAILPGAAVAATGLGTAAAGGAAAQVAAQAGTQAAATGLGSAAAAAAISARAEALAKAQLAQKASFNPKHFGKGALGVGPTALGAEAIADDAAYWAARRSAEKGVHFPGRIKAGKDGLVDEIAEEALKGSGKDFGKAAKAIDPAKSAGKWMQIRPPSVSPAARKSLLDLFLNLTGLAGLQGIAPTTVATTGAVATQTATQAGTQVATQTVLRQGGRFLPMLRGALPAAGKFIGSKIPHISALLTGYGIGNWIEENFIASDADLRARQPLPPLATVSRSVLARLGNRGLGSYDVPDFQSVRPAIDPKEAEKKRKEAERIRNQKEIDYREMMEARFSAEVDAGRSRAQQAPQGFENQAEAQMVVPVIRREQNRLYGLLRGVKRDTRDYWERVKQIWNLEEQAQNLARDAAVERAERMKKAKESQEEQAREVFRIQMTQVEAFAGRAPEGKRAQDELRRAMPVLRAEQRRNWMVAQQVQRGSAEYWDAVRNFWSVEEQITDLTNNAATEQKEATEKQERQRRAEKELLDQRVRMFEKIGQAAQEDRELFQKGLKLQALRVLANPFLTPEQRQAASRDMFLARFRQAATPSLGETEEQRVERLTELEQLRGQGYASIGAGRWGRRGRRWVPLFNVRAAMQLQNLFGGIERSVAGMPQGGPNAGGAMREYAWEQMAGGGGGPVMPMMLRALQQMSQGGPNIFNLNVQQEGNIFSDPRAQARFFYELRNALDTWSRQMAPGFGG